LVNEFDKNVGSGSKMDCHLKSNNLPLHRAFSVFLFNDKNELLLQKRAHSKILFPGHYTNTCCSHPLAVEEEMIENDALGVKNAAQRRCRQELGIAAEQIPIKDFHFLTRIHYKADNCKKWGEHEIDYILFIKANVDLHPCENEISEVSWIKKEGMIDFVKECESSGVPLTPWFRLILKNGLMKWWKHLDNIHSLQDHVTINRL